jgi:hypothetical protein
VAHTKQKSTLRCKVCAFFVSPLFALISNSNEKEVIYWDYHKASIIILRIIGGEVDYVSKLISLS